jgi:hypothetical protein
MLNVIGGFATAKTQGLIFSIRREKWLSPVIQATGRQEQWDGMRRKNLTVSTDGFQGPHYGPLHDSGVNSAKNALQSHLTRQNLAVLLFTEGQRFESQASTPANIARPCSQYCNVTCKCKKKKKIIIIIII